MLEKIDTYMNIISLETVLWSRKWMDKYTQTPYLYVSQLTIIQLLKSRAATTDSALFYENVVLYMSWSHPKKINFVFALCDLT